MLVLTRKLMEKLFIGDDICVTVVRLEGGQVRLGIDAPRDGAAVRAGRAPERARAHRRAPRRPAPPAPPPGPKPAADDPRTDPPVRIPQASAHGTGSRRRGPSQ